MGRTTLVARNRFGIGFAVMIARKSVLTEFHLPHVGTRGHHSLIPELLLMIRLLPGLRRSVLALLFLITGVTPAAAADAEVKPTSADGKVLNLDFETGTLQDWVAEGQAFAGQPIEGDTVASRRSDMRSAHEGKFWIGGYEKQFDAPVGTLTSVAFPVTHPFASFLFNGGEHATTRVELLNARTGDVFFKISGENSEELKRVIVDLKPVANQEMKIRLVDQNRGGWGHLNFDHFRFHASRPEPGRPLLPRLTSDDYPHAGLTADEAARAMQLPPGFRVTVSAAEPDVQQPIAMAIDDRGRVWVAEAYEYPNKAPRGGRDRILIFEDKDGDGRLETRKVFTEGLNLVSGLEVGFGGVWVGAAPELLFIPDANGDDVPDGAARILLDGWGLQDTHETLNTFLWGPDGWLYGCHGVFTHSEVGRPGDPPAKRQKLDAAIWRYHPTRHEFEVFAHGTSNPWGVDFNDHGQAFCTACVIPHLFHIIQGARYQRQAGQHLNPHTYRDITTIADHLHYLGANPHGGNNRSDEAGGGHAHAGAMIYLGGAWPARYRNQIFMNNIHGQRLNMDVLQPKGSGYVGRHGPDFLKTGDRASQILNLRYGPDGNAWMIDWYDMQACHTGNTQAHDRSNGRIYKISGGQSLPGPAAIGRLSDRELAELVLHQNDWYVRHSRRLLQERAAAGSLAPDAIARLIEIATRHQDETRRLRAVWSLHVTGALSMDLAAGLLADPNPFVRGWSVQLLAERQPPAWFVGRCEELARDDQSPVVRLYLASAAQRLPLASRWKILEHLVSHAGDAQDHNLPLMYWYAAEPLAAEDASRAMTLALSAGPKLPLVRDFLLRRIASLEGRAALEALVRGLGQADSAELQLAFLQSIRTALRGQRRVDAPSGWGAVSAVLAQSPRDEVRLQARALGVTFGDASALAAFRELAESKTAPDASRHEAIDALIAAGDRELAPLLQRLLQDPVTRSIAIRGLAQYDDPKTPEELLKRYSEFRPEDKRAALATLCSRPASALALLAAIEGKTLPGTDLTADLIRQLQYLKNDELQRRLVSVWGTVRESAADRLQLVEHYKKLAESDEHDATLGRAIFAKTCQRCHVLYGVGNRIGPDLTGSNRANLDYLLSNIVDPSAVMAKEYQPTILITLDGRVITGIVSAENEKSLTILTADAPVIIPKGEIEERVQSDKSMMPDDQLKLFSEFEVRSLLAYLRGKEQVALKATRATAALFFNGKDLSGWSGDPELWSVDNGEIVGRTNGLKQNEFLVSDLAAGNFRLNVDVRLLRNAGNSGIQFRSQPAGHEVKGYQADVGVGWWGKLYEELGRGLIWDKSGEAHVKHDDWNTYTIEANGSRVKTWINGKPCVDLDDPAGARTGVFAFQLHSGGATEVRFRNLRLEVLEP